MRAVAGDGFAPREITSIRALFDEAWADPDACVGIVILCYQPAANGADGARVS